MRAEGKVAVSDWEANPFIPPESASSKSHEHDHSSLAVRDIRVIVFEGFIRRSKRNGQWFVIRDQLASDIKVGKRPCRKVHSGDPISVGYNSLRKLDAAKAQLWILNDLRKRFRVSYALKLGTNSSRYDSLSRNRKFHPHLHSKSHWELEIR